MAAVWCRRRLARVPLTSVLVLVAAILVVASTSATSDGTGGGSGAATSVVVARVDLPAGIIADADDLDQVGRPLDAVPTGAATSIDAVAGRQVTATILAGEAVVDARLAPAGLLGVAAATPPGWSSFALPADHARPPLAPGQLVDLYALDPATDLAPTADARRMTRAASVVAVDDRAVTVAVRPEDASAVAAAVIGSTVVVAVTGPVSPEGEP